MLFTDNQAIIQQAKMEFRDGYVKHQQSVKYNIRIFMFI